ncbi:S41 family peptidase [Erythrobacter oryzae]|uniref:S41 family peptidase n=1 Tax=Erythrobacter oryzae TaxID=3019556 RepID=UPI0025521BBD|nr:S41 family peptidase [Erythrobacter sp. COR-2]
MKHLALCLALVAVAPAMAQPSPETPPAAPPDWSALAVADVEAVYAETRANHPGMHDPANPGFPALLERARAEALALARKATTAGGFDASLDRFTAVLNDGHAGAYATLPQELAPTIRWPGFVAAWRGDAMYVYKAAEGGPLAGSRIESCDGTPIADWVKTKVFGWRTGAEIAGAWWSMARIALVDDGNPFVRLPNSCRFVTYGKAEDRALSWSPVPDYYQEWRNGSINGDLLPIGLEERAPGIQWIALPDFQPDEAGNAAYQRLYADLAAKADAIRGARAVVLDLRYNQGGSSLWSLRVAESLWGNEAVEARADRRSAKTTVWWRPTAGNLEEVRGFARLMTEQGDAETAAWVAKLVTAFEAAAAKGETWYVEADEPAATGADTPDPAPLLTAPVYVIVPGQCASACLDAIDVFKLFPNTRLIGAPSSADSTYMEVRNPPLPSGMARAIIPMKMYVDRPRGNGEFYTPDIAMTDFDWSTQSFLKRIEADLGARF